MVDQRGLIDKMLARYSGKFIGKIISFKSEIFRRFSSTVPVFRELLQNSDDAESSAVEICFRSAGYRGHAEENTDTLALPDIKSTHVREPVFITTIWVLTC